MESLEIIKDSVQKYIRIHAPELVTMDFDNEESVSGCYFCYYCNANCSDDCPTSCSTGCSSGSCHSGVK